MYRTRQTWLRLKSGRLTPAPRMSELPDGGQQLAQVAPGAPLQGGDGAGAVLEPDLLLEIRSFGILDRLRLAGRSHRRSRFVGDVAVVVCKVRMLVCDVLFRNIQGLEPMGVVERHRDTTVMIGLLRRLCSEAHNLSCWKYSEEQQEWLVTRLGPVVGHGRRLEWEVLDSEWASDEVGTPSPAPFLTALMYEMLSDEFGLLPLAACLAKARRGVWNREGTMFTVKGLERTAGPGIWRRVVLPPNADAGAMRVVFRDGEIAGVEFEIPWRTTDRPRNSHFLPPGCRIPPVDEREYGRTLDPPYVMARRVPDKDVAYITFGKEAWRRRLGSLSAELETLLDGNYCVSRTGQTYAPMFLRNHPSLDEEALDMLWPTIAKMLWKRQFEYVERFHQLPRNVMACGAVPKNTAPWRRLITDYRPSNVFVDPWPVRYISIKGLSLLLERNSLF